jgi:hypothetical protein
VETNTNTLREPATNEVSFIRGGPFFRLQLTLRLIGPNQWNFTRRILILIAIGWLPLLMITVALNPEGLSSFIRRVSRSRSITDCRSCLAYWRRHF